MISTLKTKNNDANNYKNESRSLTIYLNKKIIEIYKTRNAKHFVI